jgi:hypothetical protein
VDGAEALVDADERDGGRGFAGLGGHALLLPLGRIALRPGASAPVRHIGHLLSAM